MSPRNADRLSSAVAALFVGALSTGIGMALAYALYGDGTRIPFAFVFVMVAEPAYRRLRAADEVREAVVGIRQVIDDADARRKAAR